jgi:hypothetical protein
VCVRAYVYIYNVYIYISTWCPFWWKMAYPGWSSLAVPVLLVCFVAGVWWHVGWWAPSTGSPEACVVSHLPHLCWSSPHFSTALVPVALYPLACQETAVVQRQERAHGQKNCVQYLTVFASPPPTFCCLHFRTMTTISKWNGLLSLLACHRVHAPTAWSVASGQKRTSLILVWTCVNHFHRSSLGLPRSPRMAPKHHRVAISS